jgi:hypothetical protein
MVSLTNTGRDIYAIEELHGKFSWMKMFSAFSLYIEAAIRPSNLNPRMGVSVISLSSLQLLKR